MRESTMMLLTMVGTLIFAGLIMGFTPYLMRKNLHFGVMLPERARELAEVKKWKKTFLKWSIGLATVGLLPMFFGFLMNLDEEALIHYISLVGTIMIAMMGIAQLIMYFYFHYKAKALKAERFSLEETRIDARIMVSTSFRNEKVIVSNMWLVVIGGLIIAVTALLPVIFYDQIPDVIPVNWGTNGATNFRPRHLRIFLLLPAIQLGMLVLFIFANYSFKATKQMIRPKNAKASLEQNRAYRYAMSKMLVTSGIGGLLLLGGPQITMMLAIDPLPSYLLWVPIFFTGFVLCSILYIAFKYGQGGERYNPIQNRNKKMNHHHELIDDDTYWKWGMIYYNPNDPAIFVEKRFGIGITFNFARWQAWAMLLGILAFIILTIIISFAMVD